MRNALMGGLALALLAAPALAEGAGSLMVEQAWSRPTPPGLDIGVGYLTVTNGGSAPERLIGAETPVAGRVELHTHVMEGDVMRMRPVEAYDIPPGGTLTLAPGGDHLMLMELKAPLALGDSVPLTLVFEKAGRVAVELKVEKPSKPAGDHQTGH